MSGYWNSIDKKETEEVIRNDSYFTRQRDALDESGGRFSKVNPTTVTGASPPTYPQIPTGPWGGSNPVPPDPATDTLGYDINEQEPILQPTADADPDDANISSSSVEQRASQEGEGDHSPTSPSALSPDASAASVSSIGDPAAARTEGGARSPSPSSVTSRFKRRF
jgi:hypothetical protein